ncbi:MAG: DUF362 domain-containing protein [Desulfoprunum sp.]|nr:DUF362 domain-containing protein [Desulfoprunum sp.]
MNDQKTPVYLARCPGYERTAVREIVENMADTLGLADSYAGRTVLLKPNLISATAPVLACTHAELIAGVATAFLDRGARVRVGDSPAFGTAVRAMQHHGIVRALAGMNVEIIEFARPVQRVLACGLQVAIAAESLDCDLLVNLPKIKAHNQMYVTLSIKNIFGIVLGMRKAMLHMTQGESHQRFAELIVDLLDILPPYVAIADGIEVMHREGPISGESLFLGCVAGCTNLVALDTALLGLLGLDHQKSPLWQATQNRNMPGSRLDDLVYPGLPPQAFAGSGFVVPDLLDGVRFNPLRFLRGILRRFLLAIHP